MTEITTGEKNPSSTGSRERRLFECYNRGLHLSTCEKNYDYAHAIFAECVVHDPGNLQFVESMIQNLRARTPHSKRSFFKLSQRGSRELKQLQQQKDWNGVIREGLELLATDPWDITTLRAMAEACAALHHTEVELVYLKQALDADPKNVEVNRHCARSLGRMGQFDQAIACWHRIEKLKGHDDEAVKNISLLTEEKFKYPGGRPPMQKRQEPQVSKAESEDPQEVVLTPQQTLEQAIAEDPENAANYLELAELLVQSRQFNAAESVLVRAIAKCGDELALVEQLNQVRILRAGHERKLAEDRQAEKRIAEAPIHIPWLELALGLAAVVLLVQLVPAAGTAVWRLIDVRQWMWFDWFVFNGILLFALIAARFAPSYRAYMVRRRIDKFRMQGSGR